MFSKIIDGSKKLADKSRNVVEIMQFQTSIDKLENEITKQKTELGAVTYRLHGEGKIQEQDIDSICSAIDTLQNEIITLNNQIADIQNKSKECPFCGAENDVSSIFCSRCGKNIDLVETGTNLCPNCSFGNAASDLFCAQCGTKLSEDTSVVADDQKLCSKCSFQNVSDAVFCANCGTML